MHRQSGTPQIVNKYLNHPKDKNEFKLISETIQEVKTNIAQDTIDIIAIFAVGTVKVCAKFGCKEKIIILNEEKELHPLLQHAKLLKFEYCKIAGKCWCYDHMNDAVMDIRCNHHGLKNCDERIAICNDHSGIYICHKNCHKGAVSCGKCGFKTMCDKCGYTLTKDILSQNKNVCHVCGISQCNNCLIKLNSREYVCTTCCNNTIINCNECGNNGILGYKGNQCIDHGKFFLCFNKECDEWICWNCQRGHFLCPSCTMECDNRLYDETDDETDNEEESFNDSVLI